MKCLKIGEVNKIGIQKTYTCAEYSKLDKEFTISYWCVNCQMKAGFFRIEPNPDAR